ncbi:hypothetical protein BKI52_20775 [marine bacterium AO1-C]|nr:hypothetical protein BKI52_20775 [marine bacterium AO1-C]
MQVRRFLLILGFLGLIQSVWSQSTILDDTTKQVYGAKTTRFFLERDLLFNRDTLYMIDTSLNNVHRYDMVQRLDNLYQDLGLMGTAIRSIYYKMPQQIGTTLGMNAYQPYVYSPDKVKYFNTRSPFTHANYAQNTRGNQKIYFRYTRNINENFNVGLHYRRENTFKQFGGQTTRELATDHHSLAIQAAYISKNKRYKLLYHFSHLNQIVFEQGGIQTNAADSNARGEIIADSLFGYEFETPFLGLTARSWQTQNTHHLYQEYRLAKQLQLFHVLHRTRQRDDYEDTGLADDGNLSYYRAFANDNITTGKSPFIYNSTGTSEGFKYWLFDNKAGVKGSIGPIYYQGYVRARQYRLEHSREGQVEAVNVVDTDVITVGGGQITQSTLDSVRTQINTRELETFVGGAFGINFSKRSRLFATAEYALTARSDYRFTANFELGNFKAKAQSVFMTPTLVQQRFTSNHFNWDRRNLNNMLANQAEASFYFRTGGIYLRPFATFTLINDYIYFDTSARPTQANELVQIVSAGLDLHFRWKKLRSETKAIYTQNLGTTEFIRIPSVLATTRLYCEDCVFSKLMHTQIGVEAHYKTSYLADAYMPVSKQFYLQDGLLVPAYPVIDVFINLQIGQVRGFLKMSHVNQPANSGYITTPNFVGMRRAFNLGINWLFFD